MNTMTKNWKTTTAGVTAILTAFGTLILTPLLDSDPATLPQWEMFISAVIGGIGLLFARDGDKTSEQIGLK